MKASIPSRRLAALCLALTALLAPAASHAALLTYDMRIVGSSSGTPLLDPHAFAFLTQDEVITLKLYAIINGSNASHADDGFLRGSGSFVSYGTLYGDLRGDSPGGGTTLQNNLAPFSGSGAQSGFQADIDHDGDLDVGSLAETGSPAGSPWFIAMGTDQQTQFGTGAGAGATEFLIGRTTFTVANNLFFGQLTDLFFLPQIKTDGTPADQMLH